MLARTRVDLSVTRPKVRHIPSETIVRILSRIDNDGLIEYELTGLDYSWKGFAYYRFVSPLTPLEELVYSLDKDH